VVRFREALRLVVDRANQLVEYLKDNGSQEPQNIDKLLLRESMDVIGVPPPHPPHVHFSVDWHALPHCLPSLSPFDIRSSLQGGGGEAASFRVRSTWSP